MAWVPRKRVVVPVDFSEESVRALREAAALAESPDSLHVVHVLDAGFINGGRELVHELVQMHELGREILFGGLRVRMQLTDAALELGALALDERLELFFQLI